VAGRPQGHIAARQITPHEIGRVGRSWSSNAPRSACCSRPSIIAHASAGLADTRRPRDCARKIYFGSEVSVSTRTRTLAAHRDLGVAPGKYTSDPKYSFQREREPSL